MRPKLLPMLAAALGIVALATVPAAATPRPAATRAAFPVTVTTGDGATTITSRPTRILSLSASSTEMLYAIGAGPQVVGVDTYSAYPANAPRTKFTGGETNAEDYVALHPDLVVLAYSEGTMIAQLRKLDIPTLLLAPVVTLAGTDAQLDELGAATGQARGATTTIASVNADLSRVVASAAGRGRDATYYIEYDQTYYSATSKTFAGSLFSRFGMVNVADKASRASSTYPQLSAEYVVKANPDYVFLADTVCCGQSPKTFAARSGFAGLRAVRLGHVVVVNDSVASQWGPHSLEAFVSVIARALAAKSGA